MEKLDSAKKYSLKEIYDPEIFRQNGYKIVDILTDYLQSATSGELKSVLTYTKPEEMLKNWQADFENQESFEAIIKKGVLMSNHLQSPRYIGHQVSIPMPLAALCQAVVGILNNSSVVYEMGPANTALEANILKWMCSLAGYDKSADGIFTSGGTLGNMTALLAARQAKVDYDIWTEGVKDNKFAFLISEQAHYSMQRSVQIMGMGEDSAILVPSDENYQMSIPDLKALYKKALNEGRKVIAVVANACSTATGSYDDLSKIADFCEEENLWLHADGAHGASALLSDKYKHLLNGIHRADSVTWDAHKMMMMPTLITAVLFKNGQNSYEAFSEKATYLFENADSKDWFDYGHRTMECTKGMMGLKLYLCLKTYGQQVFSDFIDYTYDLTSRFAGMLQDADDFMIPLEPQSNIICFRYVPNKNVDISELQVKIRQKIFEKEDFYICQTQLKDGFYLRCTIMNPFTGEFELQELMNEIREIAADLV